MFIPSTGVEGKALLVRNQSRIKGLCLRTVLAGFYQRLVRAGNPPKVSLAAVMCKLVLGTAAGLC